jgi:FtsZ-interacting cell division protein ZipA
MHSSAIALIITLAIVAIAVCGIFIRKRRSEHLRKRFGPEYDRVTQVHGSQWRAEAILETREKRVERLHIHPLAPKDRDHFAQAWQADQARFVDDPKGAVTEADRLVTEVMKARGYPVSDFEQRVADISVDHPHVIDNYRAAAEIAQRHKRGEATTEDLRQAMVYYRQLLEDLLETVEVRR